MASHDRRAPFRIPNPYGDEAVSDRDEAVKILGAAGFKVRRIGLRMYVVERRCSTNQLVKMADTAIKGLGNVTHGNNG